MVLEQDIAKLEKRIKDKDDLIKILSNGSIPAQLVNSSGAGDTAREGQLGSGLSTESSKRKKAPKASQGSSKKIKR